MPTPTPTPIATQAACDAASSSASCIYIGGFYPAAAAQFSQIADLLSALVLLVAAALVLLVVIGFPLVFLNAFRTRS